MEVANPSSEKLAELKIAAKPWLVFLRY